MYCWASENEPHTSVFNVNFCLYGTYVCTSIHCGWLSSYRMPLLLPHVPDVLPYFIEQSMSNSVTTLE